MRVICKQFCDWSGEKAVSSAWLEIGESYVVLGIRWEPRFGMKFLLWPDRDALPLLFHAAQFEELLDAAVPDSWVFAMKADGVCQMVPRTIAADEFWDRLNEGDPGAIQICREVFAREASRT